MEMTSGSCAAFFQHRDERPDGLVRIAEQHIVLLHFGGEVVLRRRQHGPGRGVEQLRVAVGLHLAGELIEEAQVQRTLLGKHTLVRQFQLPQRMRTISCGPSA